ncbi:hypothetical protein MTO96_047954 [Rhipicephalus appendiculatus]
MTMHHTYRTGLDTKQSAAKRRALLNLRAFDSPSGSLNCPCCRLLSPRPFSDGSKIQRCRRAPKMVASMPQKPWSHARAHGTASLAAL